MLDNSADLTQDTLPEKEVTSLDSGSTPNDVTHCCDNFSLKVNRNCEAEVWVVSRVNKITRVTLG